MGWEQEPGLGNRWIWLENQALKASVLWYLIEQKNIDIITDCFGRSYFLRHIWNSDTHNLEKLVLLAGNED